MLFNSLSMAVIKRLNTLFNRFSANEWDESRTDITRMDDKELHDYLHSMSKQDRRELAARLRLVKPKRRKDYKQRITDHQHQQLVYELKSRGFDGSEKEVDLLLRGGSIPSGEGLRIFYRNQRLKEDDKWRNLY